MNSNKKLKYRITALTLASTLLLSGCGGNNSGFELSENENNELVAVDDSYIRKEHIHHYYVVEVYNNVIKTNEIYIARQSNSFVGTAYIDVFTNYIIVDGSKSEPLLELVKVSRLSDYIVALGLEQLEYNYEDMVEIYDTIKKNYVFENDSTLRKKRVIGYKI